MVMDVEDLGVIDTWRKMMDAWEETMLQENIRMWKIASSEMMIIWVSYLLNCQ